MKKKRKGYASPIIIVCILCAYYIGFAIFMGRTYDVPLFFKILGIVAPLALAAGLIFMLIQRIREIKGGETDDLDKY